MLTAQQFGHDDLLAQLAVLELEQRDVYRVPGPVDLTALAALCKIEGYRDLKEPPFEPQMPGALAKRNNIFTAIRDHDIAAELIGIDIFRYKLTAFAISSFYAGVTGVLYTYYLGIANYEQFKIGVSIDYLAMIIIGGLGSIVGAFFGAAILHLLPIILRAAPSLVGLNVQAATIEQLTFMLTGALIIGVLIVEPHGLAALLKTAKQKLRVWPFPY